MRRHRLFWALLGLAMAAGLAFAWLDSRPGWDDTGITVGLVFLATAGLGAVLPQWAWLWALAVGGWIPVVEIPPSSNYGALVALAVALVGALAGALVRKAAELSLRPRG